MTYVKLLTAKNGQVEDDLRVLKGLKLEQAADSVVFGKMVGCLWWVGLLASGFALLPKHEATETAMASDDKLKVRVEHGPMESSQGSSSTAFLAAAAGGPVSKL